MNEHQILKIKNSWSIISLNHKEIGLAFYNRLFEMAPGVRHLFKGDIHTLAGKLTMILAYVVSKVDRYEEIIDKVRHLGQRHNVYGAAPEHYDVVGACLIATLREALQDQWDAETEKAWVTAFTIIKQNMLEGQMAEV
ncbi:MAG: hypothetical protein KDC49_09535 [Saprospiraceae bacterium]|nr:hypothetical protein [Saprospiraceae bacterium]